VVEIGVEQIMAALPDGGLILGARLRKAAASRALAWPMMSWSAAVARSAGFLCAPIREMRSS